MFIYILFIFSDYKDYRANYVEGYRPSIVFEVALIYKLLGFINIIYIICAHVLWPSYYISYNSHPIDFRSHRPKTEKLKLPCQCILSATIVVVSPFVSFFFKFETNCCFLFNQFVCSYFPTNGERVEEYAAQGPWPASGVHLRNKKELWRCSRDSSTKVSIITWIHVYMDLILLS